MSSFRFNMKHFTRVSRLVYIRVMVTRVCYGYHKYTLACVEKKPEQPIGHVLNQKSHQTRMTITEMTTRNCGLLSNTDEQIQ